jgi:hypothetical protein
MAVFVGTADRQEIFINNVQISLVYRRNAIDSGSSEEQLHQDVCV